MTEWSDGELLDYIESHARTELGQTHVGHVRRMYELAGEPDVCLTREWYYLDSAEVAPTIARARENLARARAAE